jgi:hypothetical protein
MNDDFVISALLMMGVVCFIIAAVVGWRVIRHRQER